MQAIFEPHLDRTPAYHSGVSEPTITRGVLAKNLRCLMQVNQPLDSNPKLSRAAKIGVGTVSRILNAKVDATVDTVTKIAKCFDLQPWQLLVPDLCPKNPPVLREMSQAESELFDRLRKVIIERTTQSRDQDPD